MQTKHLCVLIHICTRDGVGHPWGWFGPFREVFLLSVSGWCFLWTIYVISVLFLLCFHARLFVGALWSPAWKGLTSWLSFVLSNCEVATFPLVSWVGCGS